MAIRQGDYKLIVGQFARCGRDPMASEIAQRMCGWWLPLSAPENTQRIAEIAEARELNINASAQGARLKASEVGLTVLSFTPNCVVIDFELSSNCVVLRPARHLRNQLARRPQQRGRHGQQLGQHRRRPHDLYGGPGEEVGRRLSHGPGRTHTQTPAIRIQLN